MQHTDHEVIERAVTVPAARVTLQADLAVPHAAHGIVLFAHGSGSSRKSPRNREVAAELQRGKLATLLLDLLTMEEERVDAATRHLRFDIPLLASRLMAATDWVLRERDIMDLPIGYFGASTGAAAALVAAAHRRHVVHAVVSRGGRPDLAGEDLPLVKAPTLLLVGQRDVEVVGMNREALRRLGGLKELSIVPHATHLFEEPGTMATVSREALAWFERHLAGRHGGPARPSDGW